MHNDYLETIITFGWVRLGIIVTLLGLGWLTPFLGNGIPAPPEFLVVTGMAMGGILVHARFELPFQACGLYMEFVLPSALLTCLKWDHRPRWLRA